jgi:Na+-translocating ferredoxin:NAD+ oxidoreductase RnfG subunit
MKLALLLFALFLVSACSSTEKQPDYLAAQVAKHNETAAEGDKIVCRYVAETGTFVKKRVCRTQDQIKADRAAAARTMHNVMSGSTNSSAGEN